MLSFLSGLSTKIYLVVIAALGALLLTIAIYSYFLSSENDELKSDLKSYEIALDQSIKISNENENEFNLFKESNQKILETLNAEYKKDLKRYKIYVNKKEEIKHVKKSDDGINANVINSTLKWLQSKTISANTDQKNKNINTK